MRLVRRDAERPGKIQFGLKGLLEFVTICAVVLALSGATGVAPSLCLVLMALAQALRQGPAVLLTLAAASLVADHPSAASRDDGWFRQIMVLLVGMLLCTVFRLRGIRWTQDERTA